MPVRRTTNGLCYLGGSCRQGDEELRSSSRLLSAFLPFQLPSSQPRPELLRTIVSSSFFSTSPWSATFHSRPSSPTAARLHSTLHLLFSSLPSFQTTTIFTLPSSALYSEMSSRRYPPPPTGVPASQQSGPSAAMPTAAGLPPSPTPPSWPGRLPSLHLYPTSGDSMGPRTIYLHPDGTRVSSLHYQRKNSLSPEETKLTDALRTNPQQMKIGRGTSAKTQPEQGNAYFDTKVFSRAHAEVWQSNGRVSFPFV